MSESPYYTQSSPLKNQGVFSGDGNQYRFSFSVYTGENIPGGVEEDTDLYYCFQFGDYSSQPDMPGALDRCWIKKTVFEAISENINLYHYYYNIAVVKYKTGSLVVFYQGKPVGVIHNGPLSSELLWGQAVSLMLGSYVFKDEDATSLQTIYDTANILGTTSFDKLSVIFRANLLTDEDRLEYIRKEEQIAYNDVSVVSAQYGLNLVLDVDNKLDELYVSLPEYFLITTNRVDVETEDDETIEKINVSVKQNRLGDVDLSSPENVDTLSLDSLQCRSFSINSVTQEITYVGERLSFPFFFNFKGYSTDILPFLQQDQDRVIIYITITIDENNTFSTAISHVYGQNPVVPEAEEGKITKALCVVFRSGFSFYMYDLGDYNFASSGVVINFKRPPDVDDLSIERNSTNEVQIAGWETQDVEMSVDMTQMEFVARSESGALKFVGLSELMLETDAVSVDKNTDDKLEIKGWGSEASIATPEDMTNLGFVCRDGTPETNTLKFVKLDDLQTDVEVDDVTIEKDTENNEALQIKGFPSEDAVLLDLNDKGIQDGNVNETEWAFLTRVTDGETNPYLQYTKHIAARYFLKGDEDNSLGVVRGVTAAEDETDDNPLAVRLAGVNETPGETSQQRVYAYGTDGKWGLYELEMLFQLDAINKRFYYNPQKYDTGTQLVLDHDAPTAKFDFEWDSNTYNSVKMKMLVASWKDEETGIVKNAYRNLVLPKVLVSHVTAEDVVDSPTGDVVEKTVITAWRYDSNTHKIQIKTCVIECVVKEEETDWTDATTLTAGSGPMSTGSSVGHTHV